jgi:beta-lactam-binding protein with PASTA domain
VLLVHAWIQAEMKHISALCGLLYYKNTTLWINAHKYDIHSDDPSTRVYLCSPSSIAQGSLIIITVSNLQIKWVQSVLQFPREEQQTLKEKGLKLKVSTDDDTARWRPLAKLTTRDALGVGESYKTCTTPPPPRRPELFHVS